MAILEDVKLLESKVIKEIDFANQLIEENNQLKEKVEHCERRIADLEGLIQEFKEEYNRIENGILSTLNRLNHFEDAVEKSLAQGQTAPADSSPEQAAPSESDSSAEEADSQAGESETATESGAEEQDAESNPAEEQEETVTSDNAETSYSQ